MNHLARQHNKRIAEYQHTEKHAEPKRERERERERESAKMTNETDRDK